VFFIFLFFYFLMKFYFYLILIFFHITIASIINNDVILLLGFSGSFKSTITNMLINNDADRLKLTKPVTTCEVSMDCTESATINPIYRHGIFIMDVPGIQQTGNTDIVIDLLKNFNLMIPINLKHIFVTVKDRFLPSEIHIALDTLKYKGKLTFIYTNSDNCTTFHSNLKIVENFSNYSHNSICIKINYDENSLANRWKLLNVLNDILNNIKSENNYIFNIQNLINNYTQFYINQNYLIRKDYLNNFDDHQINQLIFKDEKEFLKYYNNENCSITNITEEIFETLNKLKYYKLSSKFKYIFKEYKPNCTYNCPWIIEKFNFWFVGDMICYLLSNGYIGFPLGLIFGLLLYYSIAWCIKKTKKQKRK